MIQENSLASQANWRRAYFVLLGASLLLRLVMAARFPILSDEAYFLFWGQYPDFGYYDHPPMMGWLAWLMLRWSDAPWVVRLPSVLAPLLVSGIFVALLKRMGQAQAYLAGCLILLVPANVINVIITTDTPLLVFMALSAASFVLAVHEGALRWYAIAGAMLGCAFLSKYFAVLLGLAYLVFLATSPSIPKRWKAAGLILLCSLPFGLLHAWWNYNHCWSTLLFNAFNRTSNATLGVQTIGLYVVCALYTLCPFALYRMTRVRERVRAAWRTPASRALLWLWILPYALFAVVSLGKTVGLHWMFGFISVFFASAALVLNARELRPSWIYLGFFSVLHVVAVFAVLALPLSAWEKTKSYDGIVYHTRMPELLKQIAPYRGDAVLLSAGYSAAAIASYHSGAYIPVWGLTTYHGRHDDILTDFRRFAGQRLAVLHKGVPAPGEYAPYFTHTEEHAILQDGARFTLVMGDGFNYEVYRDQILSAIRKTYYRIPKFLPVGACYFCDRYFPGETYLRR
ncbi:MAG: glycosyltransferase family 39 protein [Burkholderiales bacterium]